MLRNVLWYLLAGTRGGPMRARVLMALRNRPMNANQLAKLLAVDYKTVQHHLDLLREHHIITMHGSYGAVHILTPEMEDSWEEFTQVWTRLGQCEQLAPAKTMKTKKRPAQVSRKASLSQKSR